MRRKLILVFSALGAGAALLALGNKVLAKYEEPSYKLLEKAKDIEMRQYPSVLAAEIEVEGSGEKAANQAFRILAGYIFGKNVSREKISMTVPVTQMNSSEKIAMTVPVTSIAAEGKLIMRFYMPSKYSLDTLPKAVDSRIKFAKLPPSRYAVIKFSGFAGEDNIAKHELKLRNYLRKVGVSPQGKAVRAFYNAPWTLPFLRRNEVWLQVEVTDSKPNSDPFTLDK